MSHNQSPLIIVAAMLAGAVVGASAGVLFAPSKGRKTRKKVYREAEAITKKLVNFVNAEAKLMQVKLNGLITAANEIDEEMQQENNSMKI